jgi:DnaJ-domain-containing protein 1
MNNTSTEIERQPTPEEQELEQKKAALSVLEAELADDELELSTLKAELHAFEIRYLKIVGVKYAKLDEIEAEIAELLAAATPDDEKLQDDAKTARNRADETAKETGKAILEPTPSEKFKPSDSMKKLYREIAKKIHPDLATNPEERKRREKMMAEANRAYEEGNIERLKQILREWETSPETVEGEGIGAELIRTIRKIAQVQDRLVSIEKAVEFLKASDLYVLMLKVIEAEEKGRDLLAEMAVTVNKMIDGANIKLANINKTNRA